MLIVRTLRSLTPLSLSLSRTLTRTRTRTRTLPRTNFQNRSYSYSYSSNSRTGSYSMSLNTESESGSGSQSNHNTDSISISISTPTQTLTSKPTPTPNPKPTPNHPSNPLVWIDCEMSGLDPNVHQILEIAVIITDGDLNEIDPGIEYVIKTEKEHLDTMDEWCTTQHRKSNLTPQTLSSPHTLPSVQSHILTYLKSHIPTPKTGILAGNSVHADLAFLRVYMPDVVGFLHYRIVDVSSIKELTKRWYPHLQFHKPGSEAQHRALPDIRASIQELRWYKEHVFKKLEDTV